MAAAEDSLECRVYHSTVGYTAATQAGTDLHCNHTFAVVGGGNCDGAIAPDAQHYCDTILGYCSSAAVAIPQYNTMPECLSTIAIFKGSTPDARASNGNNDDGCRQYHAQAAASGAGNVHCTHGGPSGQYVCGGDMGPYNSWKMIANNPACKAANLSVFADGVNAAFANWALSDLMMIIPTIGNSSSPGPNFHTGYTGNNDFCRLYHCSVASTGGVSNLTHCSHCAIQSPTCTDSQTPAVDTICKMIQTGCGTKSSFASVDACVTALSPLAQSKAGDGMTLTPPPTDTLACRAFQAGLALAARKGSMQADVSANCANTGLNAGPNCGGGGASKSGAATLVVSAVAVALPFLMM
jgi:hypothetical protein